LLLLGIRSISNPSVGFRDLCRAVRTIMRHGEGVRTGALVARLTVP
jgi:hypothetical protein